MKKRMTILFLCSIILSGCVSTSVTNNFNKRYETNMKQDILCFMLAYKEIVDIERDDKNNIYLVFRSGKKLIYDDKKVKNFSEKIHNPDLEDTMSQIYPLHDIDKLMIDNYDPGRIRSYALLHEIYGDSEIVINKNLKEVKPHGNWCKFSKKNDAYKHLVRALNEIKINNNARSINLISPIEGTFCYRKISGTNRLSPHSFGIAIDVKHNKGDYWKWSSREQGQKRLNEFPRDVVRAFENNNFIWGGKWSHFDILHFEYRPELVLKTRYFHRNNQYTNKWYEGIPSQDRRAIRLAKTIDEKLN